MRLKRYNIGMLTYRFLLFCKKTLSYWLSILAFPLSCISCGQSAYGSVLCKKCATDFTDLVPPKSMRCSVCGVLLLSEKDTCLNCRTTVGDKSTEESKTEYSIRKNIDSILPLHSYVLWKKELLFAWKMANNRSLTPIFGDALFAVLRQYYATVPVVPVPPRPNKIRSKGWDQIDDLCTYLHKYHSISVCKVLKRTMLTEQKKQSREDRLKKLESRYTLKDENCHLPKEVVLIDDIMTTGSTLISCANALKKGGVEKVHAVTLFYVI